MQISGTGLCLLYGALTVASIVAYSVFGYMWWNPILPNEGTRIFGLVVLHLGGVIFGIGGLSAHFKWDW